MRPLLPIILLLSIVLSGCYDNHSPLPSGDSALSRNINIAQLRSMCREGCCNIDNDLICVGRLTSSDSEGNFYRSLVIEDKTGGVELLLGTYSIANQYPVGLEVALYLNGTAIMEKSGVVQVGLPPQGFDSSPREMESQEIIDRHLIRGTSVAAIEPIISTIATLDRSMCGRFVAVENLRYTPHDEDATTLDDYRRFTDGDGNAIFAYISPYSDFANDEMPTAILSVQGILYYESVGANMGEHYVIKPRFKDDIKTTDTIY